MPSPYYFKPAADVGPDHPVLAADLCIYNASAAGVAAAVQARRDGLNVILCNPGWHVGGLSSGGLGFTDFGNKAAVGGIALEFYRRMGVHYGVEAEWRFEPHVAEKVLTDWLAEIGVTVHHGHYLETAVVEHDRIVEIAFSHGARARAKYFIDASYEGDLMAAAGVDFTTGREANATYGETLNGQQVREKHQFNFPIDPYVTPGNPASGLLPGIEPGLPEIGAGDHRVQAYNFRVCMTQREDIRVPFPKPAVYDRSRYELLARYLAAGWDQMFWKFDMIRGLKTDTNNHGAVSSDFIGENYAWPTASHAEREKIFQAHVNYHQGLWWFYRTDPAVPADVQAKVNTWGLAGDEFADTSHWPHQLYVREARRLLGDFVMTEQHCLSKILVEDVIGLAAYTMDSHNCRRFVKDGRVFNEGDVQVHLPKPYGISYRTITPKRGQTANLLVPVCLSSSHIAYGSIRMEPVFMVLAQAAATAAAVALRQDNLPVQDVPYADLRAALEKGKQVLAWDDSKPHGNGNDNSPIGR
ncbi:MAG: FAD-dependent oxidoreductase [Verrucomicrobiota bacterium]